MKILLLSLVACSQLLVAKPSKYGFAQHDLISFGDNGQLKMLYDRRQRPNSVYIHDRAIIVFNAGGDPNGGAKSPTQPMLVSYDPATRSMSEPFVLGAGSSDHHDCPIIWADQRERLHVLYGSHNSSGYRIISQKPGDPGDNLSAWQAAPPISPSNSYPTVFQLSGQRQLIYYRTEGHTSSWGYKMSEDGRFKDDPEPVIVTDLDRIDHFQWSSYQTKQLGPEGRYLHVAFTAYDDNKVRDTDRYFNPRYQKAVSNEYKYNLYYLRIDTDTNEAVNFEGKPLTLPLDLDQANELCRIWDTDWRGAGVPPDITFDANGDPAFLHVLSGETTEQHDYYLYHRVDNAWQADRITASNHQWNSSHLRYTPDGVWRAYVLTGDVYIDTIWVESSQISDRFERGSKGYSRTGGYMDKHGGGRLEEWISRDNGQTWSMAADLTPQAPAFAGWRYNNPQPVTLPNGQPVEDLLMFYGWPLGEESPRAKAFLLHAK
jgi:hypothetical protein